MRPIKAKIVLPVLFSALLVGCGSEPQVSYKKDIKPIIDANCAECHTGNGDGLLASGFSVADYASLMKGTKYGPVIVPGDSLSSTFYRLIAGKVDPSIKMPHGKEPISQEKITMIENWIVQGAKDN